MGLLSLLMDDNKLGNQDIAADMLKDLKFAVIALGKAVTETTNPHLKQLLTNQLFTTIEQQHELADLVIEKDWDQPFLTPNEQVRNDILMSENVTS